MSLSAPIALGRGVVVDADAPVPSAWADVPDLAEVTIDDLARDSNAPALDALDDAWRRREPVVIRLEFDPASLREPEVDESPPWSLDPDLVLASDRLHYLIWANNYDARGGDPVWWWAVKAGRLGAQAAEGSLGAEAGTGDAPRADVVLPDGRPAWIDGGPRWSVPGLDDAVVHAESVEAGRLEPVPSPRAPKAHLAPDQMAAVAHPGGPVRVIAPAGSGKTRVLTERLRHLLADRGYERQSLLAVAYNKEAQLQLEERLAGLEPRTRTLNSLGYHLLAQWRGRRPAVLEEAQAREIVEEIFPIPRRRTNTDPVGPYLDALTQVRLGLIDPSLVEAGRDDVPGLAEGFDQYRGRLEATGAVDFDEQIYGTLEALLRDGAFRRRVQPAHRHLLVDEFQDLTPAHMLLLRLLAMPTLDVFAVGDDDQTIYDHAGADPRFLVDFTKFFPAAASVALEVNYRCPVAGVEAASKLLAHNRVRVEKRIRPAPDADDDPEALSIRTHAADAGASTLVDLVGGWLEEGVTPERIAVLARVNSLLLAPQIALQAAGAPVRSALGPRVLERTGIAAALAWLRVATDPGAIDPGDLEVIRRRPSRGFPRWISKWFGRCRSLGELRRIAARIDDERVSTRVGELADDIELAAEAAEEGASTRLLLEVIRDRVGLGAAMDMLDDSKGAQGSASHLDDLEGLLGVSDLRPEPDEFEGWLRDSLSQPGEGDGVTLSTVHRVKGREWDRVAVFGVTAGLLPHRLAADREAERRVLHVAITRARERCVVLGDDDRRSRFLAELRGEAPPDAEQPPGAEAPSRPAARRAPSRSSAGGGGAEDQIPPAPEAPIAERALREWRAERARGDGVPAYVVLSNRQLEGVAATMPADAAALLRCDGIGPTRLERYGEEILALLDSARAG